MIKVAFDFKKEYREFYLPASKPSIIEVPSANYLAVYGHGDPNEENGEYKQSIEMLYGIAYTLKMSYKTAYKIQGFYEYVVPPLEGFWWQDDSYSSIDYRRKSDLNFISVIRLPEFISKEDVEWAKKEATVKKKKDFSRVQFLNVNEGICVQCMHVGSYDEEPSTVNRMHEFMTENGYVLDISNERRHHEIYLSDPRKSTPEKMKTVIRHPVKRK